MFDFLTQKSTIHFAQDDIPEKFGMSGHAVGDYNFIRAFISAVAVSELRLPLWLPIEHFPVSCLPVNITGTSDC